MRVHGNLPMSPLELEIYHHFKHIIGVDPAAYEFAFMVDADTQVHEDSLNHLVSQMTRDSKIAATCGETSIANDKKSFTSMIQVLIFNRFTNISFHTIWLKHLKVCLVQLHVCPVVSVFIE